MKRWVLMVLVALAAAFGFACDCPTSTGTSCTCGCMTCPSGGYGCPECVCDTCQNPPQQIEFWADCNGRCSISCGSDMSGGAATPPPELISKMGLDESWTSGDATWCSRACSSSDSFVVTITPESGWAIKKGCERMEGCGVNIEYNDDGGATYLVSVDSTMTDPAMSMGPRYVGLCVPMVKAYWVGLMPYDTSRGSVYRQTDPGFQGPEQLFEGAWVISGYSISLRGAPADGVTCEGFRVNGGFLEGSEVSFPVGAPVSVEPVFVVRYTVTFDPGEYGEMDPGLATQVVTDFADLVWPEVKVKSEYERYWKTNGWDHSAADVTGGTTIRMQYVPRIWHWVTVDGVQEEVEHDESRTYYAPSATSGEGWRQVYLGYTGTGSFPSSGTETVVTATITEDSTLTWNFRTDYALDVWSNDSTLGAVRYNNDVVSLPFSEYVAEETWVTLRAEPVGYARCAQIVVNGQASEGDEVSFSMTGATSVGFVFERKRYKVVVGGVEEEVEGGFERTYSAPVPEVSEGVEIVYKGWRGTGSFPSEGTDESVTAQITADSTLDWLFATNYLLTVTADGPGTVVDDATGEAVPMNVYWPAETNLNLTALAQEGATCTNLLLNGEAVSGTTVSLTLTAPTAVKADFAWNTYEVTFDPGAYGALRDARLALQNVRHGLNAIEPEVVVRSEFAHDWKTNGWDVSVKGVTSNVSARAVYLRRVWNKVTVDGVDGEVEFGEKRTYSAPEQDAPEGVEIVCRGWRGTGSFPSSGTDTVVTATITEDSTLDWLFATNYLLTVTADGPGTVVDDATGVPVPSGAYWPAGTNLNLTAVPGEDARFAGWGGTGVEPLPTEAAVTLTLDWPVTLSCAFRPNHVDVVFDPTAHGTVEAEDTLRQRIAYGGDAVAPTVKAKHGWILTGWDKPFTNVTEDVTVTALYDCLYRIVVDGEVVVPDGLEDEEFVAPGECDGDGMQVVCTGWSGSGSFPESGTSNRVTVTITNDSSLVWHYVTNYWFEVVTEGPGEIRDAQSGETLGSRWMPVETNLLIEAVAEEDAHFVMWEADGVVASEGARVACFMKAPARVKATFGRPCKVAAGIDTSAWADVTEDDDILLKGVVTGGTAGGLLWRAVRANEEGRFGVAADISSSFETTVQLEAGTWRIEFYARDEEGTWSEAAVETLVVRPGAELPDLQLYGDDIAFCNADGEEVAFAAAGDAVTVRLVLRNGPRAALEGPVDVCLCEGWVTEEELAGFTSLDGRVLASVSLDEGLACGATASLDLPWTVGRDRAGNDLGYGNGPRPLTLVAVSRDKVQELRTNNNLSSRMFAIGTEADADLMRMTFDGSAVWVSGCAFSVGGTCWYGYRGETHAAVGTTVRISCDGCSVGTVHTKAPDGQFRLILAAGVQDGLSEGLHTVRAEATDGTFGCSAEFTVCVTKTPVYRPNLTVESAEVVGPGLYKNLPLCSIICRGGAVQMTARVLNNGTAAVTNVFDVAFQARKDGEEAWTTFETCRIDPVFAIGASTNLSFALPDEIMTSRETWHLRVYADPDNKIGELDDSPEDNAKACVVTVGEGPDLLLYSMRVDPEPAVVGERVSVECKVRNDGPVSTDRPFWVSVVMDGNVVGRGRITEVVEPRSERTTTVVFDTDKMTPGRHWITLKIDSDKEISELIEDNNDSRPIEFRLYPAEPDLRVRTDDISWTPSGEPKAGETYAFRATIRNKPYTVAATNLTVTFSLTDGEKTVFSDQVAVTSLPRDGRIVVTTPGTHVASRGFHVLTVSVRTEAGVDQTASDNVATTSFNVEVPKAVVGANRISDAIAGDAISLDGSKSVRCAGYDWTLVNYPQESAPVLADTTSSVATFTPDVVGTYTLQLQVRDGTFASEPAEVVVTVGRVAVDATGVCGTLSPSNRVVYAADETPTYTFVPWVLYGLESVKLDGEPLSEKACVYTFEPLRRSHRLEMRGVCHAPYDVVPDGAGGFVVTPQVVTDTVDLTGLLGAQDAEKVTVRVKPGVKTVRLPHGARLGVYADDGTKQYDITKFIRCPVENTAGRTEWDMSAAELQDVDGVIAKSLEFSSESGAAFDPTADSPITTAKTVEGLTYTLHEGASLEELTAGGKITDSKVGDGDAWRPNVSKERGNCRFYRIGVRATKPE